MRTGICSAHIMGGPLMDAARAAGSLRRPLKGRRRVQLSLRGLVQRGFQPWFLKAFSLFGLMRKDGKELNPPFLQSKPFIIKFVSIVKNECFNWLLSLWIDDEGCLMISTSLSLHQ